ncbi:MDR family MFS transporter [Marinobacter nanhaiticus D15-8W]|uniref:DHA2 family efflux MFS transporter permease subunit n=1 Tax=Marinobacter nanhaiticus D15-8W TaxID=626887 RepID=N6WQ74_9GAMM|nr:DHA2 family efflux MFS transporter permease subunit [Marinobacter nanhaiticus]ENO13192.1 DHA2 family efflux MFS transporter permease subunit [Marinobacter nanhaiticus D15-8W]BES70553.1 MDR family MFS transporter [Marinobacter nanhaiticus D15-8W]
MDRQAHVNPPISGRTWGIAAVTGAGAFMAMLDSTVANLALESIRADFATTLPVVQWVSTGYLGALAVSLPAAAWLGGRFGYGRIWAVSLALFVMASAFCAVAASPGMLIAARLLQGLAGGLMVPAGQAVIGAVAGSRQLGRIMGFLGLVIALGPAIGPAAGGFLLDVASWRWLFWINVPFGIAALLMAIRLVPEGREDPERILDIAGLLMLSLGLPLLLYGATEIGAAGLGSMAIVAGTLGAFLVGSFVLRTMNARHPLIHLHLLGMRRFAAATVITGFTGANMYGGLLLLPLYLQIVVGLEPGATGIWLLVMGLGSAVALPVAGSLADRLGAGPVSLTGAGLLLVSTIPFLFPTALSDGVLAAALLARGAGLALAQMPAVAAAYSVAHTDEMGDATTLVNIVQRVGGAIGAVAVVIVLQQVNILSTTESYICAFAALGLLSLMTLATAMVLQRQSHQPQERLAD